MSNDLNALDLLDVGIWLLKRSVEALAGRAVRFGGAEAEDRRARPTGARRFFSSGGTARAGSGCPRDPSRSRSTCRRSPWDPQ